MDHEYGNGNRDLHPATGMPRRDFANRINIGMVGINVPIPVPLAYHTFGGWKRSGFGDLNQHGPDAFRFYNADQRPSPRRWPSGHQGRRGLQLQGDGREIHVSQPLEAQPRASGGALQPRDCVDCRHGRLPNPLNWGDEGGQRGAGPAGEAR